MIIVHQYQLPLEEAVKKLNATGLSNLVFQIILDDPHTKFIFKDNSYDQACHIHERLGRVPPSIEQWIGS